MMGQDIYDWRARIGVLVPACVPNLRCEWGGGLLPHGVIFNEAIMGLVENTPEQLFALRQKALVEAKKLTDGLPQIILFGCTSGSFIGGPGYDQDLIKEISDVTGVPVTTTSTCVLSAFSDLGIKTIALVGPYTDDVLKTEVQFFREHGVETVYSKGLGLRTNKQFTYLHEQPFLYYNMAKEAWHQAPNVDCIFITCMASPSRKVINPLEQDTGTIVISSPSASIYGLLKQLRIREPIPEYGRLGMMVGET